MGCRERFPREGQKTSLMNEGVKRSTKSEDESAIFSGESAGKESTCRGR